MIYNEDEKEPFSGCKVTRVSKNGRRLLSGVSTVNFKAEFRLLAVESTDSGIYAVSRYHAQYTVYLRITKRVN